MITDLAFWISSALVMFIIGLYGLMTKRDAIRLIISIELMVMAANLVFIGFAFVGDNKNYIAQTYTILSLAIGGAIIGLALSFLVKIYEKNKTVDISELKELRW